MRCPRCQREMDDTWLLCPHDGEVLDPNAERQSSKLPHHRRTGMAGAIVGDRFQIIGFVDKGATARIYLAEDLQSHEHVIVKLYAPDEHMTDRAHELFSREAGHLMELDHPNIIKVVSFGEMGGRPYLVTEPLRGESLHDYLKREQTMPSDLALGMMRHAGLGLSAAHRAGIVHRDVKPGNLFLLGPIGR